MASCLSRQELIRPKQSDRSGCKEERGSKGAQLSVTAHTLAQRESWEQASTEIELCYSCLGSDAAAASLIGKRSG